MECSAILSLLDGTFGSTHILRVRQMTVRPSSRETYSEDPIEFDEWRSTFRTKIWKKFKERTNHTPPYGSWFAFRFANCAFYPCSTVLHFHDGGWCEPTNPKRTAFEIRSRLATRFRNWTLRFVYRRCHDYPGGTSLHIERCWMQSCRGSYLLLHQDIRTP